MVPPNFVPALLWPAAASIQTVVILSSKASPVAGRMVRVIEGGCERGTLAALQSTGTSSNRLPWPGIGNCCRVEPVTAATLPHAKAPTTNPKMRGEFALK